MVWQCVSPSTCRPQTLRMRAQQEEQADVIESHRKILLVALNGARHRNPKPEP